MNADFCVILAFTVGIFLLFVLGRLFLAPLRKLLKLAFNALLGAGSIFLANLIGSLFGFHIAFNIYTAFIVGILGIPGFILILVLKLLFNIA